MQMIVIDISMRLIQCREIQFSLVAQVQLFVTQWIAVEKLAGC